MKKLLFLLILPVVLFSIDWRAALKEAEEGNPSLPPLQIILIIDFHHPKAVLDGRIVSCDLLEMTSLLYETLSVLEGSSGKFVMALSPSLLRQIRSIPRSALKDCEGISRYLPKGFEEGDPVASWKVVCGSIPGKLVGLSSSGKISVSAIPLYSPPIGLLMKSGLEDHAVDQTEISVKWFSEMFGRVKSFLPPLLDLPPEFLEILSNLGVSFTFVDSRVITSPRSVEGINLVPVNLELSSSLADVKDESDLSNVLSSLHRIQRMGSGGMAILLRGKDFLGRGDALASIIRALSSDPYISLSFPGDLTYRLSNYAPAYRREVLSSEASLRLWELFKGIYVTYSKLSKYLKGDRLEEAKDLVYSLEDSTFYESVSKGGEFLDVFDALARKLYETLGESPKGLPRAVEFARMEVKLKVFQTVPILNGVDDDGVWTYASTFEDTGMRIKLLLTSEGLAIYVSFDGEARDLIGKSRVLIIKLGEDEYRLYFKTFRGRIYVFKNGILSGKLKKNFGVWKGVEMLLKVKIPSELSVSLLDSRERKVLSRIPQKGSLRLDEGR